MKLATFLHKTGPRVGIVDVAADRVFDIAAAAKADGIPDAPFASMLALMSAGKLALEHAHRLVDRYADDEPSFSHVLSELTLLAPVPEPPQMRDFSVFPGHIKEAPIAMQRLAARLNGRAVHNLVAPTDVPIAYREQPIYYKCNRFSVVGNDAVVQWPSYSDYMDYELEFGIFIGKSGSDIPKSEAHNHIFGYTVFNDFSARDAQYLEMRGMLGPAKGKDFDTGNVLGPWIVTADEISDPYSLRMAARVNGELWSSGSSGEMLHTFEAMIAFVSCNETLRVGEFFGSGTIGGGCGLELDRYLSDGDTVELEVERIGILRNTIQKQSPQSTNRRSA